MAYAQIGEIKEQKKEEKPVRKAYGDIYSFIPAKTIKAERVDSTKLKGSPQEQLLAGTIFHLGRDASLLAKLDEALKSPKNQDKLASALV